MLNEQQRGEEAFKLHQKITSNEEKRRELMIENILHLEKMREEKLYKDYLGDSDSKWAGYLGQIELYYTRAKVQKWIYIMKNLVNPLQLKLVDILPIPETRLEDIARYLHQSKDVTLMLTEISDLLEDAKTQIPSDWKITIGNLKGLDLENCKHQMETFEVCTTCGLKHKVNV